MSDLDQVFQQLRRIMLPYAAKLNVKTDNARGLYLHTRYIQKNKKVLFFGAVQIRKTYVSVHLMPVYVQPDLLSTLSPALKKRMQGKSCFNFTAVERDLFNELAGLVKSGYQSYQAQGFVPR
jgi:hypothetical protein